MRKVILCWFVLVLLIPAVSYGGSATSRWDLTIGGFVKADFGYADAGVSADTFLAPRRSGVNENAFDKYGNYYNAAGETRLNFLMKGPQTWGAKSSAFLEGDFRNAGGATNYGAFTLRHAYMKFDWADTSLLIGQTWQPWGYQSSYVYLNTNDLLIFNRGQRQPQITLTQRFTKEFTGTISLFSPYNSLTSQNGENVVNSYTRSGYPQIAGEILYKSDRLGKIGPWMLQFGLGGFYGVEKPAFNTATGALQTTTTYGAGGNASAATHFGSDTVNAWGASFKGYIPIIPEKKPGALANSLALAWAVFAGQDWNGPYLGAPVALPTYNQGGFSYAAPNFFGGWGQIMYYFTDKFFTNLEYGGLRRNLSNAYRAANPDVFLNIDQYIVNFIYDANAAVRVGVEFSRYYTKYGAPVSGLKDNGAFNSVRVAAVYFF